MSKIDLQYDVVNYTPASASPVEANFNRVEQHINQEVIERGGSVSMVAQLQLVGDPVNPLDAAPKQYVDQILPLGIIMMFGGAAAPPGGRWALCNGAELASAAYPELFAIIGSSFSPAGTPAGRFNLPNLVGKTAIGAGTGNVLGASGGSRDAAVVSHTHSIDHTHPLGTTFQDSPDHTHNVNHTHRVDLFTGDIVGMPGFPADHSHNMTGLGYYLRYNATATYKMHVRSSGAAFTPEELAFDWIDGTTVNTGGATFGHRHATNGVSGLMGDVPGQGVATGGANFRHQHQYQPTTMTGASGSAGVAGADANMQPYVVVSHIMRIM